MSKESQFLSNCPDIITQQAEPLRASGKLQEALDLVFKARVEPEELSQFSDKELSDLMRAWRIDVVANTSAAKRAWHGEIAVYHLLEAKDVIETYYDNPLVAAKATQFKEDNEGRPYDFAWEMERDKGRYCLAAAAITGNHAFVVAADEFFIKAIQLSGEETNRGLARMESGMIAKDWKAIKAGYQEAYYPSVARGSFDRARWTARTYFGESLKRGKIFESLKALRDLAKVRKNPVKIAADAVVGLTRSSEILSAPQHWVQRKTLPKDFKSEELKLS